MRPRWKGFHGPIAAPIQRYLAQKRALGCRFRTEERALRLFDRFLSERRISAIDEIAPALLEAFLASRPRTRPRSYNHLLCVVRRLFDWLVAQGDLACSPVRTRPRRETAQRIPFLFNAEQARRLLAAAVRLPDTANARLRGHTYRTIFALLYGLGLRVGEVSRLCARDVDRDRQLLIIRDTKFAKSRLVPFGPRIGQLLEDYFARRVARYGPLSAEALLFSFDGSKAISPTAICATFHRLLDQLELSLPPGASTPRVHDLRHSFAVGTLLRWYREGIDPSTRLVHLSTFLGHADPASTAVYLTITPELLAHASWRFERFAGEKLREVLA
jgi:site-specific recombinase XerD